MLPQNSLNSLLRKLDNTCSSETLNDDDKAKQILLICGDIAHLFNDNHDLEVQRDDLLGVSNECRRAIIAVFVGFVSATVGGTAILAGFAKHVAQGNTPPVPCDKDPLGMSALAKVLRAQKNERN